ncbi:MAG: tetratricopeptide repeat protein [Planctomycetota bacterium]
MFAKAGDDGERAQAAYGVGLVKLNRGDEPGALAAFQRAHGFNPRSSKINYRLGIAYRMAKKPDEALRHLEMVLDRNGLHEAAAYNVAMAWTQKKDAAKVKEWKRRHREIRDARVKLAGFRARLTERPGDALLLRNIAEILLEFGNHDEAVGVWRAVRAQASTDAEVVYKYALCLFHVGDYFASRTQLEQAMRLDPELKEAQALHDRIMAEFHGGERKVEAPGATRVDEDGDS